MTIKQQGGVFGRHPSFQSIELDGQDLQTELDGKADLTGDTFTGQVNVTVPTAGGMTVTSAGNGEIIAARTAGASVRMQAQSAAGTFGTTSNHGLDLITNTSARLRISNVGDVTVNTGDLIIGTAGKGLKHGASGPLWTSGAGSPEGVVTAPPGSLYTNTSGGAGTTLYVKETGTGNTGWVAK